MSLILSFSIYYEEIPAFSRQVSGIPNLRISPVVDGIALGICDIDPEVKVVQCPVALLGLVGSGKEIDFAVADAENVEGVRGAESFLASTETGKE
jgi:hypothetical protein